MRPNLSIKQRNSVGIALIILLAVVASAIGLFYTMAVEKTVCSIRHGAEKIELIAKLQNDWLKTISGIDHMLLMRQPGNIDRSVNSGLKDFGRQITAIRNRPCDRSMPENAHELRIDDELRAFGVELIEISDQLIRFVRQGRWARAQFLRHNDLASLQRRLGESLDRLSSTTQNKVNESVGRSVHVQNLMRMYWIVTSALALVLGVLAGLVTTSSITKPIAALVTTAQAIRDGDLSVQAGPVSQDELGVLASTFNSMTARLRDLIQGMEQEIAEHKRTQAALGASEARYRSLFEDSPISLWEEDFSLIKEYLENLKASGVTDMQEYFSNHPEAVIDCAERVKVLDVNKACLELFEVREKKELTQGLIHVFTEKSMEVLKQELVTLAWGGLHFEAETLQKTASGEEKFVSLHLNVPPGYKDTFGRVLVSMIDISERKKAEAALLESETRFRALAETVSVAIFIIQGERYVYVNPAFEFITGYSRETALIMNFWDIIHPDMKKIFKDRGLERQRGEKVPSEYEIKIRTKNGQTKWVDFNGATIDYKGGPATLGTAFDITDRKHAAEELKKHHDHLEELVAERTCELRIAKDQAETASKAKSDFLARMCHEIRTPINAVMGMTQLVLKSELKAHQRDYLEKAQIASRNLLEVINDILDFSKVEAGRLEIDYRPFVLDTLMDQVTDLFSHRVAQKELELILRIHPTVPRQLKGDPARLFQILTNLIENAIKFTEKGKIEVGVEIENQAEEKSDQVSLKFRVRDTGIGIAPDLLPTIFDSFTQVECYLTRTHEGTGLGLAICQRMVELMGGAIWVESEPGSGSTFYFTVHMGLSGWAESEKPDKEPENGAELTDRLDKLRGRRILVVEDNLLNREVAVALLEHIGVEVDIAGTGIEAVNKVIGSESRYDAVLMDIQMPEMDGLAATGKIRSSKSAIRNIPIIALTAHALKNEEEKCLAAGLDDFISKPFEAEQLYKTLLKWIAPRPSALPRPSICPDSLQKKALL